MRMILPGAVALLGCSVLLATEGIVESPSAPTLPEAEARNFSVQLSRILETVCSQYVRPVSRVDLARAALEGLYEAARVPVPTELAEELKQIKQDDELIALAEQTRNDLYEEIPAAAHSVLFQGLQLMKAARDAKLGALFARSRGQLGNVEPLREHRALFHSIRGMTKALDPYSGLVDGREWTRGSADDSAPSLGLEVADNLGVGPLVIRTVVPGGPAQQAGLHPGDRITHVSGKPVDGTTGIQLVAARPSTPPPPPPPPGRADPSAIAKNSEPTAVELTVARTGTVAPLTVKLEPQAFKGETVLGVMRQNDNRWDYWVDRKHKIAQVRIASLAAGTSEDVMQVVHELREQGMRGLVLDLRWCPGGFLNEAVIVALFFVGPRKVATVRNRDSQQVEYAYTMAVAGRRDLDDEKIAAIPLVVLVNGATSGGAELIAAAIQDNKRGLIAGQRTLGKASVQTPIDLIDDVKLKLTTGTFVRPSGKNLHRFPDSKASDDWGVRPDAGLELRVSAELDRQLQQWWQLQTLRPGKSCEALPLDDPAADAPRQAAVEALRSMKGSRKNAAAAIGK